MSDKVGGNHVKNFVVELVVDVVVYLYKKYYIYLFIVCFIENVTLYLEADKSGVCLKHLFEVPCSLVADFVVLFETCMSIYFILFF